MLWSPEQSFLLVYVSDELTVSRTTKCPSQLLSAAQHVRRHMKIPLCRRSSCSCVAVVSSLALICCSTIWQTWFVIFDGRPDPGLRALCTASYTCVIIRMILLSDETATWLSTPPTISACSIFIFPLHCHVQSSFTYLLLNSIITDTSHSTYCEPSS